MRSESAFTLIELMVVIAILSILASLSVTSFSVYRESAGYASAESTVRNAKTAASAGTSDADNPPPAVNLVSQNSQGPIVDPNAYLYLPGVQLGKNIKLQTSYDPDCLDPGCLAEYIRADSCLSKEYVSWTRFGDGLELDLRNVTGADCN